MGCFLAVILGGLGEITKDVMPWERTISILSGDTVKKSKYSQFAKSK
jgi:hypothetical protein